MHPLPFVENMKLEKFVINFSCVLISWLQINCEPDSTSELCTLLSSHPVVGRREDELIGFKDQIEKGDKDFTAAVME